MNHRKQVVVVGVLFFLFLSAWSSSVYADGLSLTSTVKKEVNDDPAPTKKVSPTTNNNDEESQSSNNLLDLADDNTTANDEDDHEDDAKNISFSFIKKIKETIENRLHTTALNVSLHMHRLHLVAPQNVSENESFQVTVTANNSTVANAKIRVGWNVNVYSTDANGTVTLTAPNVYDSITYMILASQLGYLNGRATITILNIVVPPQTIYVDDDNTQGPWNGTLQYPYQYIYDGVHAANPGDTVFVFNGSYSEFVTIYTDDVTLIGESPTNTLLTYSGETKPEAITVGGVDGVTIDSFCITSDYTKHGIGVYQSDNIDITNCTIYECVNGIFFDDVTNSRIMKCTIYDTYSAIANNGNGILLTGTSKYNLIEDCELYDHKNDATLGDGIDFDGAQATHNTIKNCVCYNNDDDGISIESSDIAIRNCTCYNNAGAGIYLHETSENEVYNSTIAQNLFGIYSYRSSDATITGCNITLNNDGIYLVGSGTSNKNNLIYKNDIIHNDRYGIYISGGAGNKVVANNIKANLLYGAYIMRFSFSNILYYNNFIGNGINGSSNAFDRGVSSWYMFLSPDSGRGNYWDDYNGTDEDGDGIGDTPYNLLPRPYINKDYYPFMCPIDLEGVLQTALASTHYQSSAI